MLIYQIFAFTMHKKHSKSHTKKISAWTCNDKFELPDGSYSVSNVQDYFDCIIKKQETVTENPPIKIYVIYLEALKIR